MEPPKSPRKKDSTLKKSMNVDNQEDSQDKGGKRKGKKKESAKVDKKLQKKSSFKPPTPRNDICSLCGLKDTKLYEMKCNANHFICFNCLYDFLLININEFFNEKNNKNNKKVTILKCPKCFNINNSGGIEFKNSELLALIQEHIKKGFSSEYSKTLKPCIEHENSLDFYCDTCDNYVCKLCCRYEHNGHKCCSIKDKNNEIINLISSKPLKIKEAKDFNKKIEKINSYNKKTFNDVLVKTLNEIEKCEKVLENLKQLFKHVIEKNINYYETYSKIINCSYDNYYNEIKNFKSSDYCIQHLNSLLLLNNELNNISINISQTVYQEVESTRKKLENLCSKEKISSTIKFSTHFDKIKDFVCEQEITEHSNYINDILINKENNKIITSCDDSNIRVFDVAQNYKCIQILKGHTGPVAKIAFLTNAKDSTKLLSGSEDDTIKVWEMKNSSTYEFKCINTLKGHGGTINLFALINNDEGVNEGKFASAAGDLCIKVWEPKGDYKNSSTINNSHLGKITGLTVYRNNIFLISSSEDKTMNVFSLRDENKLILKIKEHTDKINDILLCKFNLPFPLKSFEKSVSSIKEGEKNKEKENESNNVTDNKDKDKEKDKSSKRKNNKEKSIDREKEKEKSIVDKSSFSGGLQPQGERVFLISNSFDCNICLFDIENKFKLLLKQKIHQMRIKSLLKISDTLYISFSFDKTISFWSLNITQEIVEEPETKDKKKKKKEENKEKEKEKEKEKDKDKDKDKENKDKEEAMNKIIISLSCIGQINDLKWLTNTILFYPLKKSIYVGSQDKSIKIYRILNYNEYQNDNKTSLIFKNVGSLKGHDRDVTLIKGIGDDIISAGNDFVLRIWKDN